MSFKETRAATIAKMLQFRASEDENVDGVGIDLDGRQESIPVALIENPRISAQCVRAGCALRTKGAVAFRSIDGLAPILGGKGGATNATDEGFAWGWWTKEVIRKIDGTPIGTAYVLFNAQKSPKEMIALDVGWPAFIHRMAARSGRHHSRLSKIAKSIIANTPGIPGPEIRGRKSGGNLLEEERPSEKEPLKNAPPSGRLNFENSFGLEWSPAWTGYIDEQEVMAILNREKITDPTIVRRIMGEWSGMAVRGFREGADSALIWACRNELAHTAAGDSWLTDFV